MDDMNTYLIPQEIKSETMLGKGIYLIDIVIMLFIFYIMDFFKGFVHPLMQIPYMLLSLFIGFILTRRLRSNPDKRIYQALYYYLKRDKKVYHRREINIAGKEKSE